MLKINVPTEGVTNKMKAIANVLQRPMADVLDTAAHVCALECARTSQPFGTGSGAQELGQQAVAKDIAKVYATAGSVWEDLKFTAGKGVASRFWRYYKEGDHLGAQFVADAYSSKFRGVPWGRFDGGSAHKAARSKTRSGGGRGLVRQSRPSMIVTDPARLAKYVKHVQDQVGFGKGGWADAAGQLGSRSAGLKEKGGISARWITGKGHGFGKVYHLGENTPTPSVRIVNAVPYADQILEGGAKKDAIRIGHERMIKYLRAAVAAELKKLKGAA
jgi:hypothetical protein